MRTGSFTITVGGATRSGSPLYSIVNRYSRPINPTPVPIGATENDRTSTPAGRRDASAAVSHAASMSPISIGIAGSGRLPFAVDGPPSAITFLDSLPGREHPTNRQSAVRRRDLGHPRPVVLGYAFWDSVVSWGALFCRVQIAA